MHVKIKNRRKCGGHGRCKNKPSNPKPLALFPLLSGKLSPVLFICFCSWLFSLDAHGLSGPIHSWYSLSFSYFISFFRINSFLSSSKVLRDNSKLRKKNASQVTHSRESTARSPCWCGLIKWSMAEYNWWWERTCITPDRSAIQVLEIWKVSFCSQI